MYIQVERNELTGNYDVTPDVQLPPASLADMPPMAIAISGYSTCYCFLGIETTPQYIDDSDESPLWVYPEHDYGYDSVNKTYSADGNECVVFADSYFGVRVEDKFYAQPGSQMNYYVPLTEYNIVECDIPVTINGNPVSPGEVTINSGDVLRYGPVSGKACFRDGDYNYLYNLDTDKTETLTYNKTITVVARDDTNHTIGFAKYFFTIQ